MRKILRLINNEIKVIRISVVVAAISLTLFTASLFSVLNVYFNLSPNILENLDKTDNSLSFSAKNICLSEQIAGNNQGLFYGQKDGITRDTVLTNEHNAEFHTSQRIETESSINVNIYTGVAYIATDRFIQAYEQYNDCIEGMFPRQANQICLSNFAATELDVTVGDTIRIGEDSYYISAIYDETAFPDSYIYYICVDDKFVFDNVDIELATSADTYRLFNIWRAKGIDVQWMLGFEDYLEGISATDYFMLAISFAIFIANTIIIYAIFSMIVITRKKHICRMITLGATNTTIFLVFYLLLVCIVSAVNAIAYGLSNVFGEGIIDMCRTMFEMEFTVKRQPLVLLVYTVINMIMLVLMYLLQTKNISKQTILDSIKGE